MFDILMGVPEMKEFWDDLKSRKKNNELSGDEKELFKNLVKLFSF